MLAGLVTALRISSVSTSRWKRLLVRQNELLGRLRSGSGERAPLAGKAVPGNAWDAYFVALKGLSCLTESDREAVSEASRAVMPGSTVAAPKPERVEQALLALDLARPHLDAIRDAGRRDAAFYEVEWHKGLALAIPTVRQTRTAVQLFILSARRRRGAGDWEGVFEDAVAGLQLARDAARVPLLIHYLIGNSMTAAMLDELYLSLQDPALPGAIAGRLSDVLARAEENPLSPADVIESERALVNEAMRDAVRNGRLMDLGAPDTIRLMLWKQGFSLKIAAADLDEHYEKLVAALRENQERPFTDAILAYEHLAPDGRSDNPLADLLVVSVDNVDRSAREVRARLRLLQAGFAERAGAGIPAPEDPFDGRPMGRREEAGKLVLWSRWTNGDQGGHGTWRTDLSEGALADIVLEVAK